MKIFMQHVLLFLAITAASEVGWYYFLQTARLCHVPISATKF